MFALDPASGDIAWTAVSDPITRGPNAQLARIGTQTVAASSYGETGIDDAGHVLWTTRHQEPQDGSLMVALVREGAVLVATTAARPARATPSVHQPLTLRVLDAATGQERGRAELRPEGDYFAVAELARAADGRFGLHVADMRIQETVGETADHQKALTVSQFATSRLVVIDASDVAHLTTRVIAMPEAIAAPLDAKLAPSEVAYLDRYATGTETLDLRIIDLTSGRARRSVVLRPTHVDVGEGVSSFVQVTQLTTEGDRLTFAGVFAGTVAPLAARVREVDRCEAAGHIECTTGNGTTTIAPFAGLIGSLTLTR